MRGSQNQPHGYTMYQVPNTGPKSVDNTMKNTRAYINVLYRAYYTINNGGATCHIFRIRVDDPRNII